MRITPIIPTYQPQNPPKFRAQVSLNFDDYAIIDSVTRQRFQCETEAELWAKFDEIQGLVV